MRLTGVEPPLPPAMSAQDGLTEQYQEIDARYAALRTALERTLK